MTVARLRLWSSLRWRLSLAISGLVVLCTAVCLVGAVLFLRQALTDRATSDLHRTLSGVSGYLDNQRSDLLGTAQLVAGDSAVQRAVVRDDRQSLIVHLTPFYADLNADVMDVIDRHGKVVARLEDTLTGGDVVLDRPSVRAALAGKQTVALGSDLPNREAAGGFALRATVPIRSGDTVIGAVVVGRQLGSIFAARIGHALDANINLIAGNERTGTTLTDRHGLPATNLQEPASILARIASGKATVASVQDNGHAELSGIVPMQDDYGKWAGGVEVIRPLDPLYDVIKVLSLLLVALGAMVVVVGTVLALDIGRRVTSRLQILEATASRVAAMAGSNDAPLGELHIGVPVQGSDETASLARSFSAMMVALDERIAANTQLYASAQERLRELGGLAEIARLLTGVAPLSETMDVLGERVCKLVGCSAVAIWLPGEGALPSLHGGHGLPENYEQLSCESLEQMASSQFETAAQRVLRTGQVAQVEIGAEARGTRAPCLIALEAALRGSGLQGATSVPLRVQDRIVGALTCYTRSAAPMSPSDLSLLTTIADQVAVAVENSRLTAEALQASEGRFQTLVEQSPISVALFSPDGAMITGNPAWERLWGIGVEHQVGYNILRDRQLKSKGVMPAVERAFGGEAAVIPSVKYEPDPAVPRRAPIPYRWVTASIYPVKDGDGDVSQVVLMLEDITERVRAEEQLREKEAQYRGVFEETRDGLVITDLETGVIVEANPAYCAMHGYSRDEIVGLPSEAVVHDELHTDLAHLQAAISGGRTIQMMGRNVRKDGTTFPTEIHGSGFVYRGKPHVLAVVRDITERVQAYELLEQRVAERTRELSTLLEVSRNVASTLELQPLLSLILDQVNTVADFSAASVMAVDGEDLVVLELRGEAGTVPMPYMRFPAAGLGPFWDLLSSGEPIIIEDVLDDSELARAYREVNGELMETTFQHVRSFMAVPLSLKDRVIGFLSVVSSEPGRYNQRNADLTLGIARQAAIAIENARLYERAQAVAALEERQRLARELHDSVSQALYGIALGARTARKLLEQDPAQVVAPLEYVLSQAAAGLAEMRALIFELRPEALETEGLVAALDKHVESLRTRHGLNVQSSLGEEPQVSFTVKEAVYRIAQEAMHNTVKHAHARSVEVRLWSTPDEVVLEVEDDGKGFDPTASYAGHLGLETMRERATRLGGTLEVESAKGSGSRIRAALPARAVARIA